MSGTRGRHVIAMGLEITGTAGILLLAKERGILIRSSSGIIPSLTLSETIRKIAPRLVAINQAIMQTYAVFVATSLRATRLPAPEPSEQRL